MSAFGKRRNRTSDSMFLPRAARRCAQEAALCTGAPPGRCQAFVAEQQPTKSLRLRRPFIQPGSQAAGCAV